MAETKRLLSDVFQETLEAWIRAHCPCVFDDPQREFLLGLMFLVEEEVNRAAEGQRGQEPDPGGGRHLLAATAPSRSQRVARAGDGGRPGRRCASPRASIIGLCLSRQPPPRRSLPSCPP